MKRLAWRPGVGTALLLGVLALVLATAVGSDPALLRWIAGPPAFVRILLTVAFIILGFLALLRTTELIRAARGAGSARGLIRGVRMGFLAIAALSAAAGWGLGHPLPLIVAVIIAAVDVIETTFLLLVTAHRAPTDG